MLNLCLGRDIKLAFFKKIDTQITRAIMNIMRKMKRFTWDQRKALSDFANMITAAWFTAGVIAPTFAISRRQTRIMKYMIEWNFQNTYYFAAIVTSLVVIAFALIFGRRK